MATILESNKTKIAKRVIEVFEYFGTDNPSATVMDIVRRYNRPQSSTSELMACLVELGLLYKDARSRVYSPTPRLATLGSAAQPEILRDGRFYAFMDQLAQSTRFNVALFGMVDTHTQIFRWSAGSEQVIPGLESGAAEVLSQSTAGLLLLSTQGSDRARKVLWRLNAEASEATRFDHAALSQAVTGYVQHGHGTGPCGFAPGQAVTAMLLPRRLDERPLAVGVVYPANSGVDGEALTATLRHGIAQCRAPAPINDIAAPTTLMRAV